MRTEAERKEAKRLYDAKRRADRNADQIAKKRETDGAYRARAKAACTTLSAERLRELLHYDPRTGVFTRRVSVMCAKAGDVAGCAGVDGYLHIRLDGVQHRAHRLAWLYVHGEWPAHHIDHINGDKADNSISNLRDCTRAINAQNRRYGIGVAGLIGAYRNKTKWSSQILVNGKRRFLGSFDTPEEAHEAYVAAKRQLHPGCTL